MIALSSTPPFTRIGNYRRRPLLDGGLVDNVPASLAEWYPESTRTSSCSRGPCGKAPSLRRGQRLYLAPSTPVPVERWDYTRPHLVAETIAMGERESELHRGAIDALLGGSFDYPGSR